MSSSDSVQHSPRKSDDVVMEVMAPSKAITNQLVTGSLHASVYFSPASSKNENLVISVTANTAGIVSYSSSDDSDTCSSDFF